MIDFELTLLCIAILFFKNTSALATSPFCTGPDPRLPPLPCNVELLDCDAANVDTCYTY